MKHKYIFLLLSSFISACSANTHPEEIIKEKNGRYLIREFYPDGKLFSEYETTNTSKKNLPSGSIKTYDKNGKITFEGTFIDGQPDDQNKTYYPGGILQNQAYWKNGKVIENSSYNPKGILVEYDFISFANDTLFQMKNKWAYYGLTDKYSAAQSKNKDLDTQIYQEGAGLIYTSKEDTVSAGKNYKKEIIICNPPGFQRTFQYTIQSPAGNISKKELPIPDNRIIIDTTLKEKGVYTLGLNLILKNSKIGYHADRSEEIKVVVR
jgi:antitoxin component YwqK of YwqJK toxin-antitoxin module